MTISDVFVRRKLRWNSLMNLRSGKEPVKKSKCPECDSQLDYNELTNNRFICPKCGYYISIPPMDRINMIIDEDSFKELYASLKSRNPIDFPEYEKKLEINRRKTGQRDAVVTGTCRINNYKAAVAVLDSRFLMGSMGTVVGEKIARLAEYAMKRKLPLIIFSASGGARMQEGLFSLMQMAKTSAAIQNFKDNGGLFISYLTNPTTGGVSASFASLGDIIIAEPDALICFAGPRVIEQTIGQKLPPDFQHSEFLLEHGMIDMIVERKDMKKTLGLLLGMHKESGGIQIDG